VQKILKETGMKKLFNFLYLFLGHILMLDLLMKLPLQLIKSPSVNESSRLGGTQGDSSASRVKTEVQLQDKLKDELLPTVFLLVCFILNHTVIEPKIYLSWYTGRRCPGGGSWGAAGVASVKRDQGLPCARHNWL